MKKHHATMPTFRCFNCWFAFPALDTNDGLQCPCCRIILASRHMYIPDANIIPNKLEHELLTGVMKTHFSKDPDLLPGASDVVAGLGRLAKPEAIYYSQKDTRKIHPVICQVETPHSLHYGETVGKSQLFSMAAKNSGGRFYMVVPKGYFLGWGNDKTREMIDTLKIENVELLEL